MRYTKISIYKKIAAIENQEDYDDIKEELEDRYSAIPQPVYNLMDIAYIKSKAKSLGVEEVKEKNEDIHFMFQNRDRIKSSVYKRILDNYKKEVYIRLGEKPSFVYKVNEAKNENMLLDIKELLNSLTEDLG